MQLEPKVIMRLVLAFAALAAVLLFDVPASQAWSGNGPWCALINTGFGNVEEDCHYGSIEECRVDVIAGNRGFCNPNPRYVPAAGPRPRHKRHHKQH
jgi:Protein of unknown function (DUF3551)